jgi:predicted 3-demethylubiquinone-9 3-methyltransferase (glyoxalase superfamily)
VEQRYGSGLHGVLSVYNGGLAARLTPNGDDLSLGREDVTSRKSGIFNDCSPTFPRITPFLWFDSNAEEAADFYLTVFKNSRRLDVLRNTDDSRAPNGSILTVAFELDGQKFTALHGGPMFKFTEAVSLVVRCDSQQEVDDYWSKLSAGGNEGQCGWVKDKFGLSWQIVPERLANLIKRPNAMRAILRMKKRDIAELERAGQS